MSENIINSSGTQHVLIRDYETRGVVNLRDVGAWRYATHHQTSVLCCAYCVDDEPVKIWLPGDPVPPEWLEAAQNPDWLVVAFNDGFERQIEAHIMKPRHKWPVIPIERHRCLQASALALALPAKLEKVAEALGLEQRKDNAGRLNMMAISRPRKPRKGEPPGIYWNDDPARLERLYSYSKQDDEVERALWRRIGFLPPAEQAVWELDAAINDRGIFIDEALALGAIKIDEEAHASLNAELATITGGAVTSINQTEKLGAWLGARGCPVDNIQKGTLGHALTRKSIPDDARRVMQLRRDGAHAASNKFSAMMYWRDRKDGRAHGAFRYHGASTGRWASLGIQLQNMKKTPPGVDMTAAIDAVRTGDLEHLRKLHPDNPLAVVGDVARAALCAARGCRFIVEDFSGIESRITAWLAGEQSKLDQWAKFDESGSPGKAEDEPYYIVGLSFNLPPDQVRAKGKTADLAFGFMGGVGAYRKLAPDDPASGAEIKRYQMTWRRAHPAIDRFGAT